MRWHLAQEGLIASISATKRGQKPCMRRLISLLFYAPVDVPYRSHNNIVFFPYEEACHFAAQAETKGLLGLAGHRHVGELEGKSLQCNARARG